MRDTHARINLAGDRAARRRPLTLHFLHRHVQYLRDGHLHDVFQTPMRVSTLPYTKVRFRLLHRLVQYVQPDNGPERH